MFGVTVGSGRWEGFMGRTDGESDSCEAEDGKEVFSKHVDDVVVCLGKLERADVCR